MRLEINNQRGVSSLMALVPEPPKLKALEGLFLAFLGILVFGAFAGFSSPLISDSEIA